MIKIGVLASGKLGHICLAFLRKKVDLIFVLTDFNSNTIKDFCRSNSIPFFVGNPRNNVCRSFVKSFEIDILISVNYLFLVEEEILSSPKYYSVNIHGSLLPKYRGRTPHVWAIINGEKEVGVTAHLMSLGCDEGDIIEQVRIKVANEDTGASIIKKYEKVYPRLISKVLSNFKQNKIIPIKQDHAKATFFEKRTPDDGEINWNWHRERIKNWIRAQSRPYPGAFSYYGSEKITIHSSSFSDLGFTSNQINGTILEVGNGYLIIKTPNGALKIYDLEKNISFTKNTHLHARH